jgi:hypothetical protein
MKIIKLLFCCFLLTLPFSVQAQSGNGVNASDSVKAFVQGFYDWYVPKALKTFGISPQQIGKAGVADFESNFAGQKGFVRFDIQFNHAGNTATGHIALWNGANFHEWEDRYTIPAPDGGYIVKGMQFWGMQ